MIETTRLIIRNFKSTDAEALHEMIVQYEASAFAKYDHPWPTSLEEIWGVAEWFASGDNYLAVCLRKTEDGAPIEFLGCTYVLSR